MDALAVCAAEAAKVPATCIEEVDSGPMYPPCFEKLATLTGASDEDTASMISTMTAMGDSCTASTTLVRCCPSTTHLSGCLIYLCISPPRTSARWKLLPCAWEVRIALAMGAVVLKQLLGWLQMHWQKGWLLRCKFRQHGGKVNMARIRWKLHPLTACSLVPSKTNALTLA